MGELERISKQELKGMPSSKFVATEMMNEMGYNPIEKMVQQAFRLEMEEEKDEPLLLQIHKELAKYFTPQMRSVDVNINQNNSMTVNILRFDDDDDGPKAIPIRPDKVDE